MFFLLSTVYLVRKTLMPRIEVISLATTIRKSHCRSATRHVIIKMLILTLACPLKRKRCIRTISKIKDYTYSVAAAAMAVTRSAKMANKYILLNGWYFIRLVCDN